MPTVLLTAFEPFASADMNPSARVAEDISRIAFKSFRVVTATLPVVAAEVPRRLDFLLKEHRPDVVLCLGEARGSRCIRVETRAVNRLHFEVDNSGASASDQPVVPGGPQDYPSTVPTAEILARLTRSQVACAPSFSAGTFCCNQVLYFALHHAATTSPAMRAGFLHLPSLPEQRIAGQPVECGMPLARQRYAVMLALGEVARPVRLLASI